MTDHTPEPWPTWEDIPGGGSHYALNRADYDRACACVNACAGIPTERLGDVRNLANALEGMLSEWDKLTRYGSPMAKAANEQVAFACAALAPFQKD